MARYIFVTGGVVSSLGKGLSSASLAYLLKSQGYKVRVRKMDPYLNVDPGTMSPFQHGEVFVTDDGAETDLDLGHYERFTNISAKKSDNITTGKIYSDIIKKERRGKYLGKTVQVIPHVTDRIREFIKGDISNEDFVICEIGGTVGDIESLPFVEAIRQFSNEVGRTKSLFIHLTFVPFLKSSDEIKTKPTQHSVKELRSLGIQPDIIICRSQKTIPLDQRKKISLFCNVSIENVIETVDVRTIYEAPISFYNEKLDKQVLKYFNLKPRKKVNLLPWKKITKTVLTTKKKVNIAIIGKYVNLKDAYKSLDEALIHGGISNNIKVNLVRIESDKLKPNQINKILKGVSGILIPGGFGKRGTEGKISAISYARKNKIPFLGICFGMQMAVIEFARNTLKIKNAGSSELDKKCYPVVGLLNEWNKNGALIKGTNKELGGTMRLGIYEAKLKNKENLSFDESKSVFNTLMEGKATDNEIYSFLTLLSEKGEVSDEIAGGVYVLREKSKRVNVENAVDTCGTGGDGKNTLNISTAAAILLASMGVKVAKHGNKAVSSKCGSGDVLEELKININFEPKDIENQINNNNFGFMFAPNYHSAMKYVGPTRKKIGKRTIFNMIGPLSSPALVSRQVIGVFDKKLLKIFANALKNLDIKYAWIVNSEDGLDEISPYKKTYIVQLKDNLISEIIVDPNELNIKTDGFETLLGDDSKFNANKIINIFKGEDNDFSKAVCLNAAAGLIVAEKQTDFKNAYNYSRDHILSGKTFEHLKKIQNG